MLLSFAVILMNDDQLRRITIYAPYQGKSHTSHLLRVAFHFQFLVSDLSVLLVDEGIKWRWHLEEPLLSHVLSSPLTTPKEAEQWPFYFYRPGCPIDMFCYYYLSYYQIRANNTKHRKGKSL